MNEQAQLAALMELLRQYTAGNVRSEGSRNFGTSQRPAPANNQSQADMSRGLSNASVGLNLGAQLGQDQNIGQFAGILGLAAALSNPNATIGSVAPAALGAAGLGQLASVASFANSGITSSNVLGLLGMTVNPAFGLLGLVNSIAGDPIGKEVVKKTGNSGKGDSGLGATASNPNSVGIASDAGVSVGHQIANSNDQNQSGGYDTEAMNNLIGAIMGRDDSDSDSASDSDSDSDSDAGSSASNSESD